eukprot:2857123-Amphidinium_carterae.1
MTECQNLKAQIAEDETLQMAPPPAPPCPPASFAYLQAFSAALLSPAILGVQLPNTTVDALHQAIHTAAAAAAQTNMQEQQNTALPNPPLQPQQTPQ